jgi:hypothetical protein
MRNCKRELKIPLDMSRIEEEEIRELIIKIDGVKNRHKIQT